MTDIADLPTRSTPRYGWKPDLPDARDLMFAAPPEAAGRNLPAAVDLREALRFPGVYDQGALGSCTANAIAAAVYAADAYEGRDAVQKPSRLFIYYGERAIEGTIAEDSGAFIRDGIKVVAKLGAPDEQHWPYDVARFTEKPVAAAFRAAKRNVTTEYRSVPRSQIRQALAAGFPVVFGFTVYEAFESAAVASSGVLDLPGSHEEVVGGHAVLAVGYDDDAQRFTVRNSWGDTWGQAGYFTMPYAYLQNPQLASDFWTITRQSR